MTPPPLIDFDELIALADGELDDDPATRAAAEAIGAAIRRRAGWHIAPIITETITVDSDGGAVLAVPTLNMVSIEDITEHGAPITGAEWSKLGTIRKPGRRPWADAWGAVTVTFRHGYDSTPDLAAIMVELVAQAVNAPAGASSGTEKIGPFTFDSGAGGRSAALAVGSATMLTAHAAVVDSYRLERRA